MSINNEGKINNIYIDITYEPSRNQKDKTKIFGEYFVKNNKDKCKILYKDKEYELKEFFEDIINTDDLDNNLIQIKLCLNKNLNNMSYMFYNCNSLLSFGTPKLDIIYDNINNENDSLFNSSEKSINSSNLSDTNNLYDIGYDPIFMDPKLSDISKISTPFNTDNSDLWGQNNSFSLINTSQVTDMSYMFYGCHSLISLPDISKWDTYNVISLNYLFYKCNNLQSLPDISNWNISNVIYMNSIFGGCSLIKSLPDLSKWITTRANYMNSLFEGCKSLVLLPDISKWNTSNVIMINIISDL